MKTSSNVCALSLMLLLVHLSPAACGETPSPDAIKICFQEESPQQRFAVRKLSEGRVLTHMADAERADIVVITSSELGMKYGVSALLASLKPDGFSITRLPHEQIAILSSDQTGAMYGILDIAEQLQLGRTIRTLNEKTVNPALRIRGIKFNLPWNSYRKDVSLQLHESTVRDLKYWKSFLDMMAENHFNALTLWNLHPFTYMIRTKNFPEACPYSDDELRSWQDFWHELFRMASERGIKIYIFNWNIMVSHSFAKKYNVADYCLNDYPGKDFIGKGDYSPIVQQYMRESVTQLIEEYPELTGLGVSQNERMEGVEEQVWQDWIVDTYFDAMDKASRKVELILRAHTHPAPELTRKAVEENADRLGTVYIDVKFNWSHAHATPDLMYIHGGSTSKALWEPAPKNYKMIYTMRNEDFFVLRWGEPEFVREIIKRNRQEYVGGFLIGSETCIPAKEYITKPGNHLTWNYAFEKQWLFYQVWGRLMYDPDMPDDVFANSFNVRYGISFGDRLVQAHTRADKMPLALASFYAPTWDFSLYSEGFLANAPSRMKCLYDSISPFISVNEIIETNPLDSNLVSIATFMDGNVNGVHKKSPLQLADDLNRNGNEALALVQGVESVNPTLTHEIDDIKSWAYLSLYFSEKLKGGVALRRYRRTGERAQQKESIQRLEAALRHWEQVVAITNNYMDEIPLMHLNPKYVNSGNIRPLATFSWRNLLDEVKNDIRIAELSVPETPQLKVREER